LGDLGGIYCLVFIGGLGVSKVAKLLAVFSLSSFFSSFLIISFALSLF